MGRATRESEKGASLRAAWGPQPGAERTCLVLPPGGPRSISSPGPLLASPPGSGAGRGARPGNLRRSECELSRRGSRGSSRSPRGAATTRAPGTQAGSHTTLPGSGRGRGRVGVGRDGQAERFPQVRPRTGKPSPPGSCAPAPAVRCAPQRDEDSETERLLRQLGIQGRCCFSKFKRKAERVGVGGGEY